MSGQYISDQEFLKKLAGITESNLTNNQFGVSDLALKMGMSRSNLHLKVKRLTGSSASRFINKIRLKRAMELLESGTLSISDVAYDCGFNSVSYFNKCFRELYGFPPGEVDKNTKTEEFNKSRNRIISGIKMKWIINILLILAIIIPVSVISYKFFDKKVFPRRDDPGKTIAVLPFKNLNNDPEYEYFSEGIVEAINRYLFQVSEVKVISLTSAKQFLDSDKSAKEIGKELNVSSILEGSIQRDQNLMRIEVKLVDTKTESHIWAEKYDAGLEDIFKTQSEIAEKVALALKDKLSPEDKEVFNQRVAENSEAYDLYLKGIYEIRTFTRSGNNKALDLFQKAIKIDSTFALAYVGMALGNLAKGSVFGAEMSSEESLGNTKYYINKALSIKPDLIQARIWNGFYLLYHDWDFEHSEQEYKKAIVTDYSAALEVYADFLNFTRRHDEALEIARTLDEKYPYYPNSRMVLTLYYLGRYKEAEQFINSRLRLFNNFTTLNNYGFLKLNTGEYNKAISVFLEIFELEDVRYPRIIGWLGAAYARSGQRDNAIQLIEELKNISAKSNAGSPDFFLGVIYAALEENDKAIQHLQIAVENHEMEIPWLISEPQLYSLHNMPEFKKLVEIVGFPK